MSSYPFKCDLCGGVTDAPTYGDFNCQHCGQVYVYDECHRIELSERQLKTLRDSRWIQVSERLPIERPGVASEWCDRQERITLVTDGETVWQATFVISGDPAEQPTFHSPDYLVGFGDPTKVTHWQPLPEPPEAK